jgi:hypothetical protein
MQALNSNKGEIVDSYIGLTGIGTWASVWKGGSTGCGRLVCIESLTMQLTAPGVISNWVTCLTLNLFFYCGKTLLGKKGEKIVT